MISYAFAGKNSKSTISCSSSYQVSQQKQLLSAGPTTTVFNSNISYNLQLVPAKITCSMIANYNESVVDSMITQYTGPGLQFSKTLLKSTLKFALGSTYNRSYTQGELKSHILSSRASVSYFPKMKGKKFGAPTFSVNANYLDMFPVNTSSTTVELTVMGNIGYGF